MCLFCAEHMSNSGSETDAREAMTLKLKDNISTRCNVRQDVWSLEVKGRLESIIDLPAAEAVYHSKCFTRFMTGRNFVKESLTPGRHVDTDK